MPKSFVRLLFVGVVCLLGAPACRQQAPAAPAEVAENLPVLPPVMAPAPAPEPPPPPPSMLPPLPKALQFAGEDVPLHYFDVRESLQRELTILCYWHATMTYILQLSGRFFPLIRPILQEEGVPEDFIYLCVAESSLQNVVSPAGAAGFWQFMKGTAKDYGLEVDEYVDERYHLEKATRAACRYLKDSYARYGSWTLAAAAYNMGNANTEKRVKQQQDNNYYNLSLPTETGRYVFRILAFKLLMPKPQDYGFHLKEEDYYKPIACKEVKVKAPLSSLSDFARAQGTNLKLLRMCNPWLRDQKLPVRGGKHYILRVPEDGARAAK